MPSRETTGSPFAKLLVEATRTIIVGANWVRPRLTKLAGLAGLAVLAGLRWSVNHRAALIALTNRILWWGALGLLVRGGVALLGGMAPGEPEADAIRDFGISLGLCCIVLVLTTERHLRWAAMSLGLAAGVLGLLAWLVVN